MSSDRVILVEHICHDPILGMLTGTVVQRTSEGLVTRQTVSTPVDRPSLPYHEAAACLCHAVLA